MTLTIAFPGREEEAGNHLAKTSEVRYLSSSFILGPQYLGFIATFPFMRQFLN